MEDLSEFADKIGTRTLHALHFHIGMNLTEKHDQTHLQSTDLNNISITTDPTCKLRQMCFQWKAMSVSRKLKHLHPKLTPQGLGSIPVHVDLLNDYPTSQGVPWFCTSSQCSENTHIQITTGGVIYYQQLITDIDEDVVQTCLPPTTMTVKAASVSII